MLDIPQHWIDTGIEPALASGFHCDISGHAKQWQWPDQLLRATVKTGLAFHKGALGKIPPEVRASVHQQREYSTPLSIVTLPLYHSRKSMLELSFLSKAL